MVGAGSVRSRSSSVGGVSGCFGVAERGPRGRRQQASGVESVRLGYPGVVARAGARTHAARAPQGRRVGRPRRHLACVASRLRVRRRWPGGLSGHSSWFINPSVDCADRTIGVTGQSFRSRERGLGSARERSTRGPTCGRHGWMQWPGVGVGTHSAPFGSSVVGSVVMGWAALIAPSSRSGSDTRQSRRRARPARRSTPRRG